MKKNGRFQPAAIDEQQLRELWPTGERLVDLAKRWDCTKSTVGKRAAQIGLPRRNLSTATLPGNAMVRAYVDLGLSASEIARRAGISQRTCIRVLVSRGIKLRKGVTFNAKERAECARLRRHGLSIVAIAERLGISYAKARHHVRRVLGPQPQHQPTASTAQLVEWRNRGDSIRDVAKRAGVTYQTAHKRLRMARERAAMGGAQ